MIVPADLNPFNVQKNLAAENKAKDKFMKVFGKMNIPNFAEGTTKFTKEDYLKNLSPEDRAKKEKLWEKGQKKRQPIHDRIDRFLSGNKEDIEKDMKSFKEYYSTLSDTEKGYADKYISKMKKKELTREDYEAGRDKGIGGKAIDHIFNSIKYAGEYASTKIKEGVDAVVPDRDDQETEGRKFMSTAWDAIKKNVPEMAAGGAIGAGLSLFTGGIINPLFGAALGAGVSLLTNSKSIQAALFGEEVEEDGEKKFKKGLLPEKFSKNIQKYVPAMAKGGVVGALTSLLPGIPGGPVAGLIVGSAVGFASKNETIKKALFGDEETGKKGILPKDFMDKVKKALPKGVAGGIIGALTGPFGLVTNIAVGSALKSLCSVIKKKVKKAGFKKWEIMRLES